MLCPCISSALGQLYLFQATQVNLGFFIDLVFIFLAIVAFQAYSGNVVTYSGKLCFQASVSREVPDPSDRGWGSEALPTVGEDRIRCHLSKLGLHKSTGPAGMQLREVVDVSLPYQPGTVMEVG